MPWEPSWLVPFFAVSACIAAGVLLGMVIKHSKTCCRHFGSFTRGDVSAFLAESWHISVPGFPVVAALYFLTCWYRHPLSLEDGAEWNFTAVLFAACQAAGMVGLSIFTQNDYTGSSKYPLQNDAVHGIFMAIAFGSMFVYQVIHAIALGHNVACGFAAGLLPPLICLAEISLAVGAAFNFAMWQFEIMKEEFPDDPKCDKVNEWYAVLCGMGYVLTLPVLTQFVPLGSV